MDIKKVTIVGGGNIGTQFACMCASKGYEVTVFSSKPKTYDGILEVVDENNKVTTGEILKATDKMADAMDGCQLVFIAQPAFMFKETAAQMLPCITTGVNICVLPGTGGAEFAFRECMKAGAVLCGLQRVPTVARLEQYGKRVRCEGLRDSLYLAAIPARNAPALADFISLLFGIPCYTLPNYLSVTLTPSNPILHTTRLCTLFADFIDGKVYDRNPLFYGEWSVASSKLLFACDEELQEMCRQIRRLDLRDVRSLKQHYESDTISALTEKICSIRSLHNLSSPMKQIDSGWVPDFKSRYFTADFPFGLAIIEELAEIVGTEIPNIHATMDWYRKVTGDRSKLELSDYGINSVEDIYELYE